MVYIRDYGKESITFSSMFSPEFANLENPKFANLTPFFTLLVAAVISDKHSPGPMGTLALTVVLCSCLGQIMTVWEAIARKQREAKSQKGHTCLTCPPLDDPFYKPPPKLTENSTSKKQAETNSSPQPQVAELQSTKSQAKTVVAAETQPTEAKPQAQAAEKQAQSQAAKLQPAEPATDAQATPKNHQPAAAAPAEVSEGKASEEKKGEGEGEGEGEEEEGEEEAEEEGGENEATVAYNRELKAKLDSLADLLEGKHLLPTEEELQTMYEVSCHPAGSLVLFTNPKVVAATVPAAAPTSEAQKSLETAYNILANVGAAIYLGQKMGGDVPSFPLDDTLFEKMALAFKSETLPIAAVAAVARAVANLCLVSPGAAAFFVQADLPNAITKAIRKHQGAVAAFAPEAETYPLLTSILRIVAVLATYNDLQTSLDSAGLRQLAADLKGLNKFFPFCCGFFFT